MTSCFVSRLAALVPTIVLACTACVREAEAVGAEPVGPLVLLTADAEGQLGPCADCPARVGHGGMARRATLVARLRRGGPALVVDAGNGLFGGDSAATGGRVVVAAYDALGYDAANVSYRDFRHGRTATAAAFAGAAVVPLSANLLDADGKTLLFKPFVVKVVGGRRVAAVGVTEPPAGLDVLPHLRRQLDGVAFRPVADALAEWLPKAGGEADAVVVVYYGTAAGAARVRRQFGGRVAAVLVGGVRPRGLALDGVPPVLGTADHGKAVAALRLGAAAGADQHAVDPSLPDDPAVARLLSTFDATVAAGGPPGAAGSATAAPVATPVPSGNPASGATRPAVATTPPPPPAAPASLATTPTAVPPVKPTRVAAKQPHVPGGLAGVGLTQATVDAAVRRGANFVWAKARADMAEQRGFGPDEGYFIINALALVKAGHHRREPAFDAALRRFLGQVRPEGLGTYAAGALCVLVEAYGEARYEPVLRRSAKYLFEGYGSRGWDYRPKVPPAALADARADKPLQVWGGRPPEGSGAEKPWRRAATQPADVVGDNSLAQYAVMGLQAAARSGVDVPPDTWRFVEGLYRSRQDESGGWGYDRPSGLTGSMTCAGVFGLAVARHHLGDRGAATDEGVERGLAWLAARFSATDNPGAEGSYMYYYLYSLERVGVTLNTEFVGPHEWYPAGARHLLATQAADGSWPAKAYENRPDLTTSFAVLFLTRSTPKLVAERTPDGPGSLRTGLLQPPAPRVYLILDCSGSMMAVMGERTKFDVARRAVADLLAELPDHTRVALRAYGHRQTAKDQGADEDTELVLPMAALDRQAFAERLKGLRARGKTPMALSLRAAAADIDRGGGPVDVVLLTDGGEDSVPRLDPAAAAAELAGRGEGVAVHVVGFDIGRDDWGDQLRAIARRGRGRYWSAADAGALTAELRAAVLRSPGGYEVRDAAGAAVVARGTFGDDARPLPPGRYTFLTTYAGRAFREPFWVSPGSPTAVVFDAGKVDVVGPPSAEGKPPIAGVAPVAGEPPAGGGTPVPQPVPVPATPAVPVGRPKFCTQCGKPLGPAGRFCTNCGQRVGG